MSESPTAPLTTADGVPLKTSLRRAVRRSKLKAFLLVSPLLLFLVIAFVMPIFDMLWRSVDNPEVSSTLPRTVSALEGWDRESLPGEPAFAALVEDLRDGQAARNLGLLSSRLNYEKSGMRSAISRTGRRARNLEPPYREALIELNETWGELDTWKLIQREASPYTLSYYLAAVDRQLTPDGEIVKVPEHLEIHATLFWRTFWMSGVITLMTLLLGYPIAFLLANLPLRYSNLLMILVLLPFWTSLLVRTTTWIAILQSQGVLNDMMVAIGVIADEARWQMIHNKLGTIIAMTHILLPFMILPLYSVMKTIPPSYMRAARSLGGRPFLSFRRVYFPLTIPGIAAGGILVFILSIGYYITPALVGGQSGRFITNYIAYHMQTSLNWGLAAAIASILLFVVIVFYMVFNRLIGVDKVKLG
ncbi:polyamine ABC transporter substrate-binding protein [Litchfieldella qijiaojingensis]|uniref:Polyamine ABC transporter substrate-binding protein n=1 Tax=Litchfieldella qijiaojingensis TaxID=980347 RepID=A0ABQ2YDC7_9GAMM|nr:ABC transporter permease [Halomonas qijiaojingensis]GGX80166.1 polyamine ABC transporter substrate-binding protein [Halomonas qijiaojingensis]